MAFRSLAQAETYTGLVRPGAEAALGANEGVWLKEFVAGRRSWLDVMNAAREVVSSSALPRFSALSWAQSDSGEFGPILLYREHAGNT